MKITSSTEYAARLMAGLARVYGGQTLSAERLSELENIPSGYVNQILLRLKRAGLVESRRGSAGGYSLSRPAKDLTLGQIVRAVEGRIFDDVCGKYEGGSRDCRHQASCSISPVWQRLAALVEKYFDDVSLDQIVEDKPGGCAGAAELIAAGKHYGK